VKRAVLVACLCGCATTPPTERPYPPPTADALLGAVRHRAMAIRSQRAETRVDHRGEAGRLGATVLLAVRRPAKLRLDALSPFGSPLASLATDGNSIGFFDRDAGRFVRGPARACALASLVQIPLQPNEAVEVLLGGVPLLEGESSVSWNSTDAREVVRIQNTSGASQEVRLAGRPGTWTARESEVRERDGSLRWRVEHADWGSAGGVAVPARSRITDGRADLRIRFREREINVELGDRLFSTGPPPGVPVDHTDCR
jgi:outer membrane lipoprotein-sorting protein